MPRSLLREAFIFPKLRLTQYIRRTSFAQILATLKLLISSKR